MYLARQVDRRRRRPLAALDLPGIGFLPVEQATTRRARSPPRSWGSSNVDGVGVTGLEPPTTTCSRARRGAARRRSPRRGVEIGAGWRRSTGAVPGVDLVLTIDREIQFMAQQYLRRRGQENRAKGGTMVVMDPDDRGHLRDGDLPVVRPEPLRSSSSRDRYANRAVTDAWEPGSVNKIITAAAALETGPWPAPSDSSCRPTRTVGGFTIHDSHPHPVESMTIGDIIAHSQQHRELARRRPRRATSRWPHYFDTVRVRPADRGRLPRARRPGLMPPVAMEGHHARDRLVRRGRRGDAAADGVGLRDDRQRRRLGAAAAGARRRSIRRAVRRRPGPREHATGRAPRDGRPAHADARLRGRGRHRDQRADRRLPGRRQDRDREEARRVRPLHEPLRRLVHRVPAGVGARGRDRGDPRRAAHRLRGRRGRTRCSRTWRATRSSGSGSSRRRPCALPPPRCSPRHDPAGRACRLAGGGPSLPPRAAPHAVAEVCGAPRSAATPRSRSATSRTTPGPSRRARCSSACPASIARRARVRSRRGRGRRRRPASSSGGSSVGVPQLLVAVGAERRWGRCPPRSSGVRPTRCATVGVTGTNGKTTAPTCWRPSSAPRAASRA